MAEPRPLAFWLALVDRMVEERVSAALEEHGVTRTQWRILAVLVAGEANAEELDDALGDLASGEDHETAAEGLDELIDSGWVQPGPSFSITERGESAYAGLEEAVSVLRSTLTEGVSEASQAETVAVLERMARNLGWNG